MNEHGYEPNSWQAQFSRMLAKIDFSEHQSGTYRTEMREITADIQASVEKLVVLLSEQNGRVKKLETWRTEQTAKIAIIAVIAGGLGTGMISLLGWLIPVLYKK